MVWTPDRSRSGVFLFQLSPRHFNYSAHAYASPIEPPTQSIHTPFLDLAPGAIKARYRGDFVLEKGGGGPDPLDPPSVSAPVYGTPRNEQRRKRNIARIFPSNLAHEHVWRSNLVSTLRTWNRW